MLRAIRSSASSSAIRWRERPYSLAFSIACPTWEAMVATSSTSSGVHGRGTRVRTLSAPTSRSRARIGTARNDS